MNERVTGHVKSVIHDKGFGFVRDAEGGEWFFHKSQCFPKGTFTVLAVGTKVDFAPNEHNEKGPRAEDVRLL